MIESVSHYAINQQHHIVTMMAIVRIHAELVHNFECVLAPIPDIDETIVKRSAIVSLEAVVGAKCACGPEDIWSDDLFEQTLKLGIRKLHSV